MNIDELYNEAGLTDDDRSRMPSYIKGDDEFYGSSAFGKLYDYFCNSEEMPYGVAKARDGDPVDWILDYISACN